MSLTRAQIWVRDVKRLVLTAVSRGQAARGKKRKPSQSLEKWKAFEARRTEQEIIFVYQSRIYLKSFVEQK